MGTGSLTATCGTIVLALLVVWGLNWYCVNEKPTGWIGNDLCPAINPLYKFSGTVLDWFVGLFGEDSTKAPVPKRPASQGGLLETRPMEQVSVANRLSRDGCHIPEATKRVWAVRRWVQGEVADSSEALRLARAGGNVGTGVL